MQHVCATAKVECIPYQGRVPSEGLQALVQWSLRQLHTTRTAGAGACPLAAKSKSPSVGAARRGPPLSLQHLSVRFLSPTYTRAAPAVVTPPVRAYTLHA